MIFAKSENGFIQRCPRVGLSGGRLHSNLPRFYEDNPIAALQDGWKELILTDRPEGAFAPEYVETETRIQQLWVAEPIPEPTPTLTEDVLQLKKDVNDLTEAVLEMSETVYA